MLGERQSLLRGNLRYLERGTHLALVAVDQNRVHFRVVDDFKGVGDTLERDCVGFGLVSWDRDHEVLNVVLFHKRGVLGRVVLRDERAVRVVSRGRWDGTKGGSGGKQAYRIVFSPRERRCA